jgi:lysophospholipase L1-like esterase
VSLVCHPSGARSTIGWILIGALVIVALSFQSCERTILPGVPTLADMQENFGRVYPVTSSDYLPFTSPPMTAITDPEGAFGAISYNALGCRGPDPRTIEKPPGKTRALLLGDSFVLGWGLREEQSISGQLRARLNPAPGPSRYEVINAGYRAGYSPDAYYAYLKKEGLALKPDWIAVQIFTHNDFNDVATNVWEETDELGGPTRLYSRRLFPDHRATLLSAKALPWNYKVPLLGRSRMFVAAGNGFNELFLGEDARIASDLVGEPLPPEETARRMETALTALSRLCEREHIPIVFLWFDWVGRHRSDHLQEPMLREVIEQKLRRPYRALHDVLQDSHRIPDDAHTNAEGARVISDALYELAKPWM